MTLTRAVELIKNAKSPNDLKDLLRSHEFLLELLMRPQGLTSAIIDKAYALGKGEDNE